MQAALPADRGGLGRNGEREDLEAILERRRKASMPPALKRRSLCVHSEREGSIWQIGSSASTPLEWEKPLLVAPRQTCGHGLRFALIRVTCHTILRRRTEPRSVPPV